MFLGHGSFSCGFQNGQDHLLAYIELITHVNDTKNDRNIVYYRPLQEVTYLGYD